MLLRLTHKIIMETPDNRYAAALESLGNFVTVVNGIAWYDYNGFMTPAYLPHCCPKITMAIARNVVEATGRPFARWDSKFGEVEDSQWWYVNRRPPWLFEQCSAKTRNQIRKGSKDFHARVAAVDEISKHGYEVCRKSAQRYEKDIFLPTPQVFHRKVETAKSCGETFEFFGVFSGDRLVGFSENYIQQGGVFWESIWCDPEFLPGYSNYVLICGMLNHYLNDRKCEYVSDGSRSIFHRTGVQEFFMQKFGFKKDFALMNVAYSPRFRAAVQLVYPFRAVVWALCNKWTNNTLDKVGGILRQECIKRACEEKKDGLED